MACRVVTILMIVVSTAIAAADPGLAQPTGIASAIHQGNCDDVGDAVAPLVDMTIAEGEPSGNAAALPAANSFTTVPISLEALAASDHACLFFVAEALATLPTLIPSAVTIEASSAPAWGLIHGAGAMFAMLLWSSAVMLMATSETG